MYTTVTVLVVILDILLPLQKMFLKTMMFSGAGAAPKQNGSETLGSGVGRGVVD